MVGSQLSLDVLVVVLAGLPHYLHTRLLQFIEMLQHALVHGPGSQAATNDEDGLLVGVEPHGLAGLSTAERTVEERLAHGISREHKFVGGEEPLHALVGHADLAGFLGQQLVGDTGIGVLLLDEARDTHVGAFVECGTAGIATHAHCHHGAELADDLLGQALALPYLVEHCDIAQQVLAVETANRQTLDVISCGGHALHLHASFCPYEENLGIGPFHLDGISNGDGREDVSPCASSADNDS